MRAIAYTLTAAVVAIGLAGCSSTPVISDISDSSVKVQSQAASADATVMAKANEGCGLYKKKAVALSRRCLDGYCINKEYLFACQ